MIFRRSKIGTSLAIDYLCNFSSKDFVHCCFSSNSFCFASYICGLNILLPVLLLYLAALPQPCTIKKTIAEKIRKKEEKQRERFRLGLRSLLPNLIHSTIYKLFGEVQLTS